ncbi:phosphate ABC transporter ATP-binding protein [Candidatus Leptofilum sp.]|uniref:ABC transporter ATP-binding protein n=1 Tax=Candidatus Leptofilum sp. TaxID=3241576 RepID=UPI003B5904FD
MSEPIFELEQVQQVYDGRTVLDISQLTIHKGEILALVGPSGAGKSTLLRLLNFLEPACKGTIRFDGQVATPELDLVQRRRVTTVFQRPLLLQRSVRANLRYGLGLRGQKLAEAKEEEWLARLGLAELADQAAPKLSAGEAQRVALARAVVTQPDVLLLDEPTANLDPSNVGIIESIIQEENQCSGMTVVLVTHNIFQARRIAHRTALLWAGELIEVAETEQFFSAPGREETAAFVRGDTVY